MKKQVIVLACLLGYWAGYSNSQTFHSSNPLLDIRSTGTALNLGDDNTSGAIKLPFSFQFFGRSFNTIAVNANGIVSFNENIRPGYWPQVLNKNLDPQYNYTLFPLWTDLVSNNGPYIRLNTDNVVVGWYDVLEYRNPTRKSSFEVQLWNTNSFEFRYNSVSLGRQPLTIGYSGDLSKYEYKNWYRSYGGTTELKDFSYYYDPLQQCEFNQSYNPLCKNYNAALLLQQCSLDPLYSISCPGYSRALLEKTCITNPQVCNKSASTIQETEYVPTRTTRITQQDVVTTRVVENTKAAVTQETQPQQEQSAVVLINNSTAPKPQQAQEKNQPLVINAVQEIVGGPDVNAFQTSLPGFSNYSSLVLKDVAFYPVREVYKNQQTTDNRTAVRVLGIAQENRWQELVNIQFRLGE